MRNGLAVLSELGKVYSCLLMTACSNEALSALGPWIQPVNATDWANRSAGVS